MTTTPDTVVDVDAVLAQLIADPATASVPLVDLCAHLHHPAVAELRPDPLGNYLVLFALTVGDCDPEARADHVLQTLGVAR